MASFLECLGQVAFLILVGIQGASPPPYPAGYANKDGFYGVALPCILAFFLSLFISVRDGRIRAVWLLLNFAAECAMIAFTLVILIKAVVGETDRLDKQAFFGPIILMMILFVLSSILVVLRCLL